MVERARLAAQRREIVDRVEDQRLLLVTACVRRDDPPFRNEHDAIDVALDGHHPVGEGPRDAVAIAVEGDGLVLVHSDRGIDHAGVERMLGEGGAAARSSARRVLIRNGPRSDCTVRSRSASQHLRKNRFNSSRSATRGTGVASGVARP